MPRRYRYSRCQFPRSYWHVLPPGKNTKTIIIVALRGIREYLSPPKNNTAHICHARSARTDVLASLSLVWWHQTYAPLLPRIYLSCEPCAPLCPVRLCLLHMYSLCMFRTHRQAQVQRRTHLGARILIFWWRPATICFPRKYSI